MEEWEWECGHKMANSTSPFRDNSQGQVQTRELEVIKSCSKHKVKWHVRLSSKTSFELTYGCELVIPSWGGWVCHILDWTELNWSLDWTQLFLLHATYNYCMQPRTISTDEEQLWTIATVADTISRPWCKLLQCNSSYMLSHPTIQNVQQKLWETSMP